MGGIFTEPLTPLKAPKSYFLNLFLAGEVKISVQKKNKQCQSGFASIFGNFSSSSHKGRTYILSNSFKLTKARDADVLNG